jgi:hypothetical protein
LFLIHRNPIVGNLQSEIAIPNDRLLQPLLQSFRAGRGDVVLDGVLDEAAALARPRHAVNGADGF